MMLIGERLVYQVGGQTILDGVSITVDPGERVALVGPSGSGKTTLLTLLAGLARPTSGRVLLDGGELWDSPVRRRTIALVLQGYGLVSLLTAAENVEIALRGGGEPARRATQIAAEVLADMGLAAHRDHLIDELSGGQQQRVAVARALALAPRVLLADEPTAEQDPAHRSLVLDRLLSVSHAGTALVIATHDLEVAEQCDRVVDLSAPEFVS